MSWRIKMKARKAPKGMDVITPKLEEFETRTREALNAPPDDKRRNEISWPIHKLHYEKNRYLYEMRRSHKISKQLLDYLIKEKIADGKLIAKWRRPGYERLCSLAVITKSNMNFGGVGVCRIPLKQRRGQIMPNVLTGCVSCASGDGGPIWWDDPVPDIVKQRIIEIDPGKAEILEEKDDAERPNDENDNQQEDGNVEDGSAEDGSAEDGSAEDGSAEDGSAEDGSAEDGSAEDGSAEDRGAEDRGAEDVGAEEASAEEATAKDGDAEDGNATRPSKVGDVTQEAVL